MGEDKKHAPFLFFFSSRFGLWQVLEPEAYEGVNGPGNGLVKR